MLYAITNVTVIDMISSDADARLHGDRHRTTESPLSVPPTQSHVPERGEGR